MSKLSFHTKRVASKLKLKEFTSDNTKTIATNMTLMYPEYKRMPMPMLIEAISETYKSWCESEADRDGEKSGAKGAVVEDSDIRKRKKRLKSSGAANGTVMSGEGAEGSASSSSMGESEENYRQERPKVRFHNVAGVDSVLTQIREQVFYPVEYAALYKHLNITPPSGLLLHGPSGCGKTLLANAIAGELGLPYFKVSGPELIGGTSGESERRIRSFFQMAIDAAPSIVFIDAFDVIAGKRDATQRGMDRRVVAQLFDSIDRIANDPVDETSDMTGSSNNDGNMDIDGIQNKDESSNQAEGGDVSEAAASHVILIAATNRPDGLDLSVRGRFAKEIALPVPDALARSEILRLLMKDVNTQDGIVWSELGRLTPGFVGADLRALSREAGTIAVRRIVASSQRNDNGIPFDIVKVMPGTAVEMGDLTAAIQCIHPSAKREGFAVVPDVSWSDVGALADVREELIQNVLEPIAHPERFRRLGLEVPAGVLFFGPPGCGKTLLAKALANYSGANFISVKGPELLNMYVGESESKVRQVFARARASVPCVIFFDELDALCPKRSSGDAGGNGVSERVVNQLLTELDGLEVRKDVYVIAATNRLERIDDAMLRPGRLGKLLYVPLPNQSDRGSILSACVKRVHLNSNEDPRFGGIPNLEAIAADERSDGFSGADLAALVREAGMAVMREMRQVSEDQRDELCERAAIGARHFEEALQRTRPSVAREDRLRYARVQAFLTAGLGPVEALNAAATQMAVETLDTP